MEKENLPQKKQLSPWHTFVACFRPACYYVVVYTQLQYVKLDSQHAFRSAYNMMNMEN